MNHLLVTTSNVQISFQSLSNYPEIKFVTLFDIHNAVLLNELVCFIDEFTVSNITLDFYFDEDKKQEKATFF